MRMDQFAGHSPSAQAFLAENKRPPLHCPTCGHITETYVKQCGIFYGMFDNEYPLAKFPLKDGTFAMEFLQTAPWSSGPIHFLGLRLEDGTELTWTDAEIEEWI